MLRRAVGSPARAASALLVVAAVVVQAWIVVRSGSFNLSRLAGEDRHVDFDTFWRSARALLRGADLYATGAALPNLNPPLLTVVMAPLGLLDMLPAYRLFTLVSLALVLASVLAVVRELRLPAPDAAVAVAALLLSAPLLATLGLGQIYALLSAALTVSWLAARRGSAVVEGVGLGIAVALKPSLAPLLALPLLRRTWCTAVVAILTTVAGTGVGVVVAGPAASAAWLELVLGRPVQTYFDNASLPASIVRLTTENAWARPLVEVPGGLVAGTALGVAVVLTTLWVARRRGAPDLGVWALAAASLLASPVTWHTYLVVLAPAVVIVLQCSRVAAAPLLALPLIGQEWPSVWYGDDGLAPALPLTLYCAILLAHWAVFLRLARRARVASAT